MFKNLQKNEKGFTIIEVLIVLAIAGLIMLVVFLAVPALQRNSRNSQYRAEASNLIGAYNEVSANKNGAVLTASVSSCAAPGCDAKKVIDAANTRNITTVTIAAHSATAVTIADVNNAVIRTGAKCAAADSGTATAGNTRQVALYFNVETPAGLQLQCLEA